MHSIKLRDLHAVRTRLGKTQDITPAYLPVMNMLLASCGVPSFMHTGKFLVPAGRCTWLFLPSNVHVCWVQSQPSQTEPLTFLEPAYC